jgi:hypothetical protein
LSDDASSAIALFASFADAIVADNGAPAAALEALARLAALLGSCALAGVANHAFVHLDKGLDTLEGVHEIYSDFGLVVGSLSLVLHVILLLLVAA